MGRPPNKVRGVFEREKGSGVWWISYANQGKIYKEKVGKFVDAKARLERRRADIQRDDFDPADLKLRKVTVAEIIDDRLTVASNLKSFRDERQHLLWWKEQLGTRTVRSVVASDIEEAKRKLAVGRKPATVNRYLAAFKSAFSLAVRNKKSKGNPVKEVRLEKENNRRVRWLKPEEETRLFEVLPDKYKPVVTIALNTGLRKTEQLSLRWDDVDFQNGLITVRESKSGTSRHVHINDEALETFKSLREERFKNGLLTNPYVFVGRSPGSRLKDLPNDWEKILREAGIEDFRWHDLRHTFASRLVMNGIDIYTVQKLLGHHSTEMTQRYAHLSSEHMQQAVNTLCRTSPKLPQRVRGG